MIPAYNKDGEPISVLEWAHLSEDLGYKHVRMSTVGDVEISTVWVGIDYNFSGVGPPWIFETMVFGGEFDEHQERWPNIDAAEAGHEQWVARVKESEVTCE